NIYAQYVERVLNSRSVDGEIKGFFHFIKTLALLLNHPKILLKYLNEQSTKRAKKHIADMQELMPPLAEPSSPSTADEELDNLLPDDNDIVIYEKATSEEDLDVNGSIRDQILNTALGCNIESIDHSFRFKVLLEIVETCSRINEKIL